MLKICSLLVLLSAGLAVQVHAQRHFQGTVQIVDGDTLDVGDVRVRLYGIDAPEIGQTCQTAEGSTWACGAWASREVRSRFEGKKANCKVIEHDIHDRVVAICQIKGRDIGQELVEEGIALAFRRYSMAYDRDEKTAADAGKGVHAGKVQHPSDYRKARRAGHNAPGAGCVIKGNISRSGERIFHLPGQRYYGTTRIRQNKGERWFCTKRDALRSGWRKARL